LFFDVFIGITSSAIGAFLGFVGALYLQARTEKHVKKCRDALVLKNLKDEISNISLPLSEYLEKGIPLKHDIQTPNWDAVLYSGAILEFIENPVYAQTISVYSNIKHFNGMKNSFNKEDNLIAIKDIVDASEHIVHQEQIKEKREYV